MIQRTLLLLCLITAAASLAEDAKARAAREELERQLSQMVGQQPAKVRVDYAGLDEPNYQIEEASFELDGRSLRSPLVSELSAEGRHLVWTGEVPPGKHTVKVLLVFVNATSAVLSDEGGYKWRVGGSVSFDVQAGIEVGVVITPSRDPSQQDLSKRFRLALPARPVMLARVDDGKMPEPVKAAVLVPVQDAGVSPPLVAAVTDTNAPRGDAAAESKRVAAEKAAAAAEAKRAAAEEKKRKAEEAAEAKRLAAEERKRKVAELREARRLAAEEKKRKAAEALEAKRLAAEEKKRLAAEAAEAKRAAAEGRAVAAVPVDAGLEAPGRVEPVDAGAEAVAVAEPVDAGAETSLDAGAPEAVAQVVPDAGAPVAIAPPTVTETPEGPPWLLIGGAGGIALIIALVVLARRSSRPPTLDD